LESRKIGRLYKWRIGDSEYRKGGTSEHRDIGGLDLWKIGTSVHWMIGR